MQNDNTTTETPRELLYRLIELAEQLAPEGEGLDLSDLDLEPEMIAELRGRAGTLRSAVDAVNRALAYQWADQLPHPRAVTMLPGERLAKLSWAKAKPKWLDGTGLTFADWLLTQPAEIVARATSTQTRDKQLIPAIQKNAVPPGVYDTFAGIDFEEKETPSLSVTALAMIDTKWIQNLAEGDIARYERGGIVWYQGGPE